MDISIIMDKIPVVLAGVGTAVARSLTGWFENAMKDGKIENYEWGQLGATVIRVSLLTIGVNVGFGMDAISSAASAFVGDFIITALKKRSMNK